MHHPCNFAEAKLHCHNGRYVIQTGVEVKRKLDLLEWWEEESPVADAVMLGKRVFAWYGLGLAGE